jgi:hypothetical protein
VAASEEARAQIRAKLNELHAAHAAQKIEEERRRFDQLTSERYPYAPEAFSVISGPRHPRGVDLRALAEPPASAVPLARPLPAEPAR